MKIQPIHLVVFLAGVAMGAAFLMSCGGGSNSADAHTDFATVYFGEDVLNTNSITATTTFAPLGPPLVFDKVSDTTKIEVFLNTRVSVDSFVGASGLQVQVRVDGNGPNVVGNEGSVLNTHNPSFVSVLGVFSGLAAGAHTAQVYVATNSGTANTVRLDIGGWDGALITREVP